MFRAGCTDEGRELIDKRLKSHWEEEVSGKTARSVLGCMPIPMRANVKHNFALIDDLIPDYANYIDSQWHASRYANRLRKLAAEMEETV